MKKRWFLTIGIISLCATLFSGWMQPILSKSKTATKEQNPKWGYIDQTGQIIIAQAYDEARPFSE